MKYIIGVLLLLNCGLVSGQSDDSTETIQRPRFDPENCGWNQIAADTARFVNYDSSFSGVQRYHPGFASNLPFQDLGAIGTPAKRLSFTPLLEPGYQTGFNQFNLYSKTVRDARFYKSKQPYSQFNYWQGAQRLSILEAFHTQNIRPNLNIAIDFRSQNYSGIYMQGYQNSFKKPNIANKNIRFSSLYHSKNNRLTTAVVLTWNRYYRTETGNANIRLDSIISTPKYFDYSIKTASSLFTQTHHTVKSWFGLLGTPINDSQKYYPLKAYATLNYRKEAIRYFDTKADTAFYRITTIADESYVSDTFISKFYEAEAGIASGSKAIIPFEAGIARSVVKNKHVNRTDYDLNNTRLHLNITPTFGKKNTLQVAIKSEYFLSGNNASDYLIDFFTLKKINKKTWAAFSLTNQNVSAPQIYRSFTNDFGSWNNNFKKQFTINYSATLGYASKFLSLTATAFSTNVDGLFYFDTLARASQYTSLKTSTGAFVKLKLAGKRWNSSTTLLTQTNPYPDYVLNIPSFYVTEQLYWQKQVFKKALLLQIGFDVFLQSKVYLNNYMPSVGQFFVQNKLKTGSYPNMDFFINGEVKTLRFFLKMEHINQYMMGSTLNSQYYSSFLYPMEPRRFRLGIQWKFYY